MNKVTLLADNQMIARVGLRTLLKKHFKIEEGDIDDVESCSGVMTHLKTKCYSYWITEMNLTDGSTSSIIPTVKSLYKDLQILVFSELSEHLLIKPLSSFGVYHFLSKFCPEKEAIKKIEAFFHNASPISSLGAIDKNSKLLGLAPREFEIYSRLLNNMPTGRIAKELNIDNSTVSTVKRRIFNKSNVENMEQLLYLAKLNNGQQK
ncbi:LuxR C-terminal-related transcriptional regulator [Puia dinghuensis]|nr:LuxR C-terminal-related transcriptional regulator [Puia dinghuensis]